MKTFYGCTFIKERHEGINNYYPIKLEYNKTKEDTDKLMIKEDEAKYGIEVVKTVYENNGVNVEKTSITEMGCDENRLDRILETLREYHVTPVTTEDVVRDLLKNG